jgi:hypothetical protein
MSDLLPMNNHDKNMLQLDGINFEGYQKFLKFDLLEELKTI